MYMRGVGSALFVGILLMIAGILNIVYGIAAVGNAHFWVNDTQFVFSTLHTWGWITIILGIIQLTASLSLFGGNAYGRVVGIVAASLGAIGALLDVGGQHPGGGVGGGVPAGGRPAAPRPPAMIDALVKAATRVRSTPERRPAPGRSGATPGQ